MQLTHHLFKPDEMQGRNVRGVEGKLLLDPEKIQVIKDAVLKYYLVPPSGIKKGFKESIKIKDWTL